MTPTLRRASRKEEVDNPPSAPEPSPSTQNDFSPFVWQKLNDLDRRFADFCEKYGRSEAAIEANTHAIEKLDAKLDSSIEKLDVKLDHVVEKLSGVTHKIYAASVVLAILLAIGAFVVNKAWDVAATHLVEISKAAVSQKDK